MVSELIYSYFIGYLFFQILLGTYVCTDVPGEFRWQAGALTQAVQQGRWAVMEDIDRAPFEVWYFKEGVVLL